MSKLPEYRYGDVIKKSKKPGLNMTVMQKVAMRFGITLKTKEEQQYRIIQLR